MLQLRGAGCRSQKPGLSVRGLMLSLQGTIWGIDIRVSAAETQPLRQRPAGLSLAHSNQCDSYQAAELGDVRQTMITMLSRSIAYSVLSSCS